jgi:hypothetical protein
MDCKRAVLAFADAPGAWRPALRALSLALLVTLAGCKKSAPVPAAPSSAPPSGAASPAAAALETVARVHWRGEAAIAADPHGAAFREIGRLPASAALATQTLDKLASAPWRLFNLNTNGAPVAALRPLLDDLFRQEAYLEIRNAGHQPGELALALRLGPARAGVWETNLAAVMESLTGLRPAPAPAGRPGWTLTKHDAPNLVELTRAGAWTLVGLGTDTNGLLGRFRARIERDGSPVAPAASARHEGGRATNFHWLEAGFDLRRVGRALPFLDGRLPETFPRIFLTVAGHDGGVRAEGQLDFAQPLPEELPPWNIPTNLIQAPLAGFTAVRGLWPWLTSLKLPEVEPLLPWPDEVFVWSRKGFPLQTYFTAAVPDASNRVARLRQSLMQKLNPWLATNGMGRVEPLPFTNGFWWSGLPVMQAFVQTVPSPGGDCVFGGLLPPGPTNQPPPGELLNAITSRTNLVLYDWEITQDSVESCLFLGQIVRLALHKAQLPAHSASMAWLKAAGPNLGNTVTLLTRTGPSQISFLRQSSFGLTGVELQLLADWLESPRFPAGLHTLVAPPEDWAMKPPPTAPASKKP